jgi:gamma-glutamylaminecyclotransferase
MAEDERTRVFVFGTLKAGFPNFGVNRGRRVGGVFRTVDRLPLWLVGDRHVPWLIDAPGEGEHIAGEVYEVDAAALAAMDELEGVGRPDGYHRATIRVRADGDGAEWPVQIYMKRPDQLVRAEMRQGPLAEYTLAHAALYRKRGEQAY